MVKSFLLAFPMMVLTFVMLSGGKMSDDPKKMVAFAITFLFVNILFFLMIRTGKTDKYRSILFISYAVCFIISFITHLIELRGSMAISGANMLDGRTPFCHIVIPMTLIPAALTKTIIFPGTTKRTA